MPEHGANERIETRDAPAVESFEEHGHASMRTYLIVGVLLAITTVIEVQLPTWLAADRTIMVVSLLLSAGVKAALVALFYMHLKYDSRVYPGLMALSFVLLAYFLALLTWGHWPL